MAVANPYAEDLGNRVPLEALADTADRIRRLVEPWSADVFEKSYAPGKWSARQILVHLAQTELALSTRARFALAQPGYTAQPFSQDEWMSIDGRADARTALGAYTSLRGLNLAMWRGLTQEQVDSLTTYCYQNFPKGPQTATTTPTSANPSVVVPPAPAKN